MQKGGRVIIEGTDAFALQPVLPLLGIADSIVSSEPLRACYARIETGFEELTKRTGNTALLPFGGVIGYCDPAEDSEVLLTLVPPFTPAKFSGSPAERASLPVSHTEIPLSILHRMGEGALMFIPGELGWLYRSFGLKDYADMIISSVDRLLPEEERLQVEAPGDVLCTTFRKEKELLIHLVNFVGERPIRERICCHNIRIRIPENMGKNAQKAEAVISGQPVRLQQEDGQLILTLEKLEAWEMLKILLDT